MKRLISILFVLTFTGIIAQLSAQTAIFEGSLFTNNNEASIRAGGDSLQIALDGETWVVGLGDDNDSTLSLLASISGTGNWATLAGSLDYTGPVDYLRSRGV